MQSNQARERVLSAAEQLFHDRGYNAVSMRDIAEALEMRQASLYYHVPNGKEQLFVEVTERGLNRHKQGLKEFITAADSNLVAQLAAAAQWLVDHTPIKLLSMLETDMPAISTPNAQKLTYMAYQAFFQPVNDLFAKSIEKGELRQFDSMQLTGHFLSMMDGISYTATAGHTPMPITKMVEDMIDILLNGARPR